MPDLDQLLAEDARDSHDESAPALGSAVDRARRSTRHRHQLAGGAAAVVAAALGGSLLYAATSTPHRSETKLAAYDHVIGADPEHSGRYVVIGPQDEHVANCSKLSGVTVMRSPDGTLFALLDHGRSAIGKLPSGGLPSRVDLGGAGAHPDKRYHVYSCPMN